MTDQKELIVTSVLIIRGGPVAHILSLVFAIIGIPLEIIRLEVMMYVHLRILLLIDIAVKQTQYGHKEKGLVVITI